MGQREGLGDQVAPGPGREPERSRELGDRELRDEGCAVAGDRDPGVLTAPRPQRRRIVEVADLVQPGPLDRGDQHLHRR
jgi:hypothetical protein